MDKNEGAIFAEIPPNALALTLTRSTIKMWHSPTWSIDKTNSVHDLIICLSGKALYEIEGNTIEIGAGDALLIPAHTRFLGHSTSKELYTGVAQHFSLDLFGSLDLLKQMDFRRSVRFPNWAVFEGMVRRYHEIAAPSSTTLLQHHLFMVLLMEFIGAAFIDWRDQSVGNINNPDALSFAIMVAASQIVAEPLSETVAETVVQNAPYNADYFKREFKRQIGWTPAKFQEFKRMERAMGLLASGCNVKQTAERSGYNDSYYFSRMFKRYIGVSPAGYKEAERRHREGAFPRGEEDGQVLYPLLASE
ncbi:AraC family transcriptional regulator [Agrobacterium larrymoorei]|uniref:AraC family transcriptional regulator n=1 Tax=Agrobacterium larrymoorei TaxID=160699 RepID=UPI001572F651|nr:AraC family transcriptional regulator [Agrobacterium larrymoorei]NTJ44338.1 AraC family transcriptional regulator [Agrobacterium larrymoorei]